MCDNKFINNTNNLQMANYRLWNFTFLKIHPVYIKAQRYFLQTWLTYHKRY